MFESADLFKQHGRAADGDEHHELAARGRLLDGRPRRRVSRRLSSVDTGQRTPLIFPETWLITRSAVSKSLWQPGSLPLAVLIRRLITRSAVSKFRARR